MRIKDKEIGGENPVFIIAEISCNHNQDFDTAVEIIKSAQRAGADAVKIQTYTPDTITLDSDKKDFQITQNKLWNGQTLYNLYKKAYTPWDWQPKLKKIAEESGLIFFSSPFDKTAVDFLENLGVPCYKIASFEMTDIPLIEYTASKGKPMIMSTGISTLEEIEEAVNACKRKNNNQIILLKCTSEYPAPFENMNINTIPDLAKKFNAIIGLSDHSKGIQIPITAVALGAKVIEKHLMLENNKKDSPDYEFSLIPQEFEEMVKSIRITEKALGKIDYSLTSATEKSREHSRSLYVVKNIAKGEQLTEQNIRSIRPGFGLPPKYLNEVLGKKANQNIESGTALSRDFFE